MKRYIIVERQLFRLQNVLKQQLQRYKITIKYTVVC